MDANLSFKPAVSVVSTEPVRPAASAPVTTPTDLPTANTVTEVAKTPSTRNDPAQTDRPIKSELVLDPQSNQVIYRVLEADSRRVIWQVPEKAVLRLRAYTRAAATETGGSPPPSTSLKA
jgi:hypothetical protein